MHTQSISVELLLEAEWNANRVRPGLLAKLQRSLEQFGVVENLVARPHPTVPDAFEVLSGNHRLRLLRELGYTAAPVVVVELGDARARLLAQTLNRTRGVDDPRAYARVLEEVLAELEISEVTGLLPESEATIYGVLREFGGGDTREEQLPPLPLVARSRPGEIYELGGHRLACGDATDPGLVAELLAGERPFLLATDPPYGVGLDHGWRDGVRQPSGSARAGKLANDDRADWREAFALCEAAQVAYVWHSALHAHLVREGLMACGFELRQQIVWAKQVHALGRGHYQWSHETCWYAVRKGRSANWQGGRKQTTVWHAEPARLSRGDLPGALRPRPGRAQARARRVSANRTGATRSACTHPDPRQEVRHR
jgi:hypothetical protein